MGSAPGLVLVYSSSELALPGFLLLVAVVVVFSSVTRSTSEGGDASRLRGGGPLVSDGLVYPMGSFAMSLVVCVSALALAAQAR